MYLNKMNTGFENEEEFAHFFNKKIYSDLDNNSKLFIKSLFPDIKDNGLIYARNMSDIHKGDITIYYKNKSALISIKKGARNSVHVEGLDTFINFLKSSLVPQKVINYYLEYHFGDNTIDGTGTIRLSAEELKQNKEMKDKIGKINKFFNKKRLVRKCIDRFIISGIYGHDSINGIIYGTTNEYKWAMVNEIYKLFEVKFDKDYTEPHFNHLSVQCANRCINRNPKYEFQRKKIQIKWYNLTDDLDYIKEFIRK